MDLLEKKDLRVTRATLDHKDLLDLLDPRETREIKDHLDLLDMKELLDLWGLLDPRATRETLVHKDPWDLLVHVDQRDKTVTLERTESMVATVVMDAMGTMGPTDLPDLRDLLDLKVLAEMTEPSLSARSSLFHAKTQSLPPVLMDPALLEEVVTVALLVPSKAPTLPPSPPGLLAAELATPPPALPHTTPHIAPSLVPPTLFALLDLLGTVPSTLESEVLPPTTLRATTLGDPTKPFMNGGVGNSDWVGTGFSVGTLL